MYTVLTVDTGPGDRLRDLNPVGQHSRRFDHRVHWIFPIGIDDQDRRHAVDPNQFGQHSRR